VHASSRPADDPLSLVPRHDTAGEALAGGKANLPQGHYPRRIIEA